jgi:hypothetical protein
VAEDVVVKDALTPEMTDAGRRLLEQLDTTAWRPPASLWLFVPEAGQWRLLLADPQLEATGPKTAYRQVLDALRRVAVPESTLSLRDIAVVDPNDPLLHILRAAIRTGPGITAIRFSKNVINGQYIDDAFIYRLM